jgi:hypothetical protein
MFWALFDITRAAMGSGDSRIGLLCSEYCSACQARDKITNSLCTSRATKRHAASAPPRCPARMVTMSHSDGLPFVNDLTFDCHPVWHQSQWKRLTRAVAGSGFVALTNTISRLEHEQMR